jgi:hypothetical protein
MPAVYVMKVQVINAKRRQPRFFVNIPLPLARKNHRVSRKVRQACLGRGVRAENEAFLQMSRGALPQGRFSVRTTPFFGLF